MSRISTDGKGFYRGYIDDGRLASINHLAPPSFNTILTNTAVAETRLGYDATSWNLNQANKVAVPYHMSDFNVTFFAIGTKMLFIDHNNSDQVVDTGLTLTDGTVTTFGEYARDLYSTNTTDGLRMVHVMRLDDASATLGDSTVVVDQDGAARLIAFSHNTSSYTLYINGVSQGTISSVNINGTITLTGTLAATYPNDSIAFVAADISSGRPKGSKLVFWKERMYLFGVIGDTNTYNSTYVDVAPANVYASKFATRDGLENLISFDVTSTADIFTIGKSGAITNAVVAKDFLYFFKENAVYALSPDGIATDTGATAPRELTDSSNNAVSYGCSSVFLATYIGNDEIAFADIKRKRIFRIKVSTDSGAAVTYIDETFDNPYSNTLKQLDEGTTDAQFYYDAADKRAYFECDFNGERLSLPYNTILGVWEPPQRNRSFSHYFNVGAQLYATDRADDTIYKMNFTSSDDGTPIEYAIATGLIATEHRDSLEIETLTYSAEFTANSSPTFQWRLSKDATLNEKTIDISNLNFGSEGATIGAAEISASIIAGDSDSREFVSKDGAFGFFQFGREFQGIFTDYGEGAAMKLKALTLTINPISKTTFTLT